MDSSPLTRLPPEIRNTIYEFLFMTGYAVTLKHGKILHPLTMTCRQMRRETLRMYLSLTAFNAHLDDGPALPLARWLRALGPDLCLALKEANIWDMHMLNGSLHGVATTRRMLRNHPDDEDHYMLQRIGRDIFHKNWFLKDIKLPLQGMGIGLERFCIVHADGVSLKQTSSFALKPAMELSGRESCAGIASEFGLSERELESLEDQLDMGMREVRLLDGRRYVVVNFDGQQRLVAMRQEYIPRDEEFYL